MVAELVKDVGGSISYDLTELGRPTTATVTLYEPDGTVLQAAASATVDTVNTTATGALSAGATTIALTSATGVVQGRSYLLTSTGAQEEATIKSISSNTVTLFEALEYAHATGATFVGRRLTYSVSAALAATLGEGYEALWIYTVTTERRRVSLWDVVRTAWPDVLLTAADFKSYAQEAGIDVLQMVEQQGLDFKNEIERATERVRAAILNRGFRPALFRSHDAFRYPIAMRVLLTWAQSGANVPSLYQQQPEMYVEQRRQVYEDALSEALNNTRSYDADESGSTSSGERGIRLGTARMVL